MNSKLLLVCNRQIDTLRRNDVFCVTADWFCFGATFDSSEIGFALFHSFELYNHDDLSFAHEKKTKFLSIELGSTKIEKSAFFLNLTSTHGKKVKKFVFQPISLFFLLRTTEWPQNHQSCWNVINQKKGARLMYQFRFSSESLIKSFSNWSIGIKFGNWVLAGRTIHAIRSKIKIISYFSAGILMYLFMRARCLHTMSNLTGSYFNYTNKMIE